MGNRLSAHHRTATKRRGGNPRDERGRKKQNSVAEQRAEADRDANPALVACAAMRPSPTFFVPFRLGDTEWAQPRLVASGGFGSFFTLVGASAAGGADALLGVKVVPSPVGDETMQSTLGFWAEAEAMAAAARVHAGPTFHGAAMCDAAADATARGVMVMDVWFGDGHDLFYKKGQQLSEDDTRAFLAAVDRMHAAHILHGDASENNMLVRQRAGADGYEAVPADFGKALRLDAFARIARGDHAADDPRWLEYRETVRLDAHTDASEFYEWITAGAPWAVRASVPAAMQDISDRALRNTLSARVADVRRRAAGPADAVVLAASDPVLLHAFAGLLLRRTLMADVVMFGCGMLDDAASNVFTAIDGQADEPDHAVQDLLDATDAKRDLRTIVANKHYADPNAHVAKSLREYELTLAQAPYAADAAVVRALEYREQARKFARENQKTHKWLTLGRYSLAMHWPTFAKWVSWRAGDDAELQRALRERVAGAGVVLHADSLADGITPSQLERPVARPWYERLVRYVYTASDVRATLARLGMPWEATRGVTTYFDDMASDAKMSADGRGRSDRDVVQKLVVKEWSRLLAQIR